MSDEDKKTDEKQQEEEQKIDWDKNKQELDQERANAKKAREEAESYATALTEARSKTTELENKIKAKEQEQADTKDELAALDPDLVDRNVIQNFERQEKKLAAMKKKLEAQELKARAYEEAEAKRREQSECQKAIDEVLSDCDKEFGAKYRNDALKLADNLVDSGKEKQPTTQFAGYKLMRKCYQQVIADEKKATDKKEPPPTDGGSGGAALDLTKVKTGSVEDVLADMKKTGSWKTG